MIHLFFGILSPFAAVRALEGLYRSVPGLRSGPPGTAWRRFMDAVEGCVEAMDAAHIAQLAPAIRTGVASRSL